MPYIQVKVNVPIPQEKELRLKTELGKIIEMIPGKSEQWLMISFEEEQTLYFRGDDKVPVAHVGVNIYGHADDVVYDKLTVAITNLLSGTLLIQPENIYIQYTETGHWGWNGSNF